LNILEARLMFASRMVREHGYVVLSSNYPCDLKAVLRDEVCEQLGGHPLVVIGTATREEFMEQSEELNRELDFFPTQEQNQQHLKDYPYYYKAIAE
jgi:hypothetical protein